MQIIDLVHIFDTENDCWLDSLPRQRIFHLCIWILFTFWKNILAEHNLHFVKHKVQE